MYCPIIDTPSANDSGRNETCEIFNSAHDQKNYSLTENCLLTEGNNVRHDNGAIPNLLNELNQCKPEDSGAMRNFACENGSSYSQSHSGS